MTLVDVDSGKHEDLDYWKPDFPLVRDAKRGRSLDECVEQTEQLFNEAVRLRMRADVPVGVYLSGGLDSALVAAKMAEIGASKLTAFTVAFNDQSRQYNELAQAQVVAQHLGLHHRVVHAGPRQLWENLESCLRHVERPMHNLAPVGRYLLSALASQHVKVVLSGEGADEVFLGYRQFVRSYSSVGRASELMNERWKEARDQLFLRNRPVPTVARRSGRLCLFENPAYRGW